MMTRVKLGVTRGAAAPVRAFSSRATVPIPAPKPRFRREKLEAYSEGGFEDVE